MKANTAVKVQSEPKKKPAEQKGVIYIPAIQWEETRVRLVGTAPMIIRNFDDKAQEAILARQQKKPVQREIKDPEANYERARLLDAKGRDCVKSLWIKCACIDAARNIDGVTMASLKGVLFIKGVEDRDLVPIVHDAKKPRIRRDAVRLQGTTADLAYRPEYNAWSLDIIARYRRDLISLESVISLLNVAGQSVGLCERRPGQNGDQFGQFEVDPKRIVVLGGKSA